MSKAVLGKTGSRAVKNASDVSAVEVEYGQNYALWGMLDGEERRNLKVTSSSGVRFEDGSRPGDQLEEYVREGRTQLDEVDSQGRTDSGFASSGTCSSIQCLDDVGQEDKFRRLPSMPYVQDKFRSLMNFLDEKECTPKPQTGGSAHKIASLPQEQSEPHCQLAPSIPARADHAFDFLDDQEALILTLRLHLSKLADDSARHLRDHETEAEKKLRQLKKSHTAKLKIQQDLLGQANQDKKVLKERCDTLTVDMKQMQTKLERRIQELEERHQDEVKRLKTQWEAAEKLRRQQWITARAQKIKDETLKSVEPEIQRMLDSHKDEATQLQNRYEDLLRMAENKEQRRSRVQLQELEGKTAQLVTEARHHERHLVEQACAERKEELERTWRIAMAKKEEEHLVNRGFLEEQLLGLKEEIKRVRVESDEQRAAAVVAERTRAEEERRAIAEAHKRQIEELRTEIQTNLEQWKISFAASQEVLREQDHREMAAQMKADRDSQISSALAGLAQEVAKMHTDLEKGHETKTVRLQERHRQELDDLESLVENWKKIATESKECVRVHQEAETNVRSQCEAAEKELADALQKVNQLESGRESIDNAITAKYALQISNLDEEIDRLIEAIKTADEQHTQEKTRITKQMELLKHKHDMALDAINERIRDTLSKKDGKIEMLRKQLFEAHQQTTRTTGSITSISRQAPLPKARKVPTNSRPHQ